MTPSAKTIKILLFLLRNPTPITKDQILSKLQFENSAFKTARTAFSQVGFQLNVDTKNRYTLQIDEHISELGFLQSLNDRDIQLLEDSLNYTSNKKAYHIMNKLKKLTNVLNLGLPGLQFGELIKLELLKKARKEKKQVILRNYNSLLSKTRDRFVEVHHIDPALNTIQLFDIEKKENRHYRIVRIGSVEIMESGWEYEAKHKAKLTDVFGIANDNKKFVRFSMNKFGKTQLIESFPMSKNTISNAGKEDFYVFEDNINADFKGLTNFILQNMEYAEIEIDDNQELKDKLKEIIQKFSKKLDEL